MSDTGICESCSEHFPYNLLHSGFADAAYGYCDRCGTTAIISGWSKYPADAPLEVHKAITPAIERFLANCACGGHFKSGAAPRCRSCTNPLSAELAAAWIEANAPGVSKGWRWQRDWIGLYGIVIDKHMVSDPWRPELLQPNA